MLVLTTALPRGDQATGCPRPVGRQTFRQRYSQLEMLQTASEERRAAQCTRIEPHAGRGVTGEQSSPWKEALARCASWSSCWPADQPTLPISLSQLALALQYTLMSHPGLKPLSQILVLLQRTRTRLLLLSSLGRSCRGPHYQSAEVKNIRGIPSLSQTEIKAGERKGLAGGRCLARDCGQRQAQ